jgi:hypothetical protein
MDLRLKVLAALDRGESQVSVARRFDLGLRTVKRFKARRDAGRVEPDKTGPKLPKKITPQDDQLMRDMVAQRPGITANELRAMLSVEVDVAQFDLLVDPPAVYARLKPKRRLVLIGLEKRFVVDHIFNKLFRSGFNFFCVNIKVFKNN